MDGETKTESKTEIHTVIVLRTQLKRSNKCIRKSSLF